MSILSELNTLLEGIGIPVETSVFSGEVPKEYVVLTPLTDDFDLFADNLPGIEVCEVRLTLFSKGNYLQTKNRITNALLLKNFTITLRQYVGIDNDTGFHNYTIDVAKFYQI